MLKNFQTSRFNWHETLPSLAPSLKLGSHLEFFFLSVLYLTGYNQLGGRHWSWIAYFSWFSPKGWIRLKSSALDILEGETVQGVGLTQEHFVWLCPHKEGMHGWSLFRMCSSPQGPGEGSQGILPYQPCVSSPALSLPLPCLSPPCLSSFATFPLHRCVLSPYLEKTLHFSMD